MFVLHTSNKIENLLEHLHHVLSTPLDNPFDKEVFLIQSQGMERWLSQQLAERFGVWGNFEYLFPGNFFNTMAETLGIDLHNHEFSRDALLWRVEHLLRDIDQPVYASLQKYLQGYSVDMKRFQLAQQLAYLYDQYQFMRPDWVENWQAGQLNTEQKTEQWQQAFWLKLTENSIGDNHAQLWLQAIDNLKALSTDEIEAKLPQRVSIFGINTMSPFYLSFLQHLSTAIDVHFYLLNPCAAYWADIETKRQQVRNKRDHQADDESVIIANPLLASLGQQGRDFQSLLLDLTDFTVDIDSFEEHEAHSLLQTIQNDILNNTIGHHRFDYDDSIHLHSCHSRIREIEVVKDQILHALSQDNRLSLRDIVIMAPDIQEYTPYISAVFDPKTYAIADKSGRANNAVLDVFLRFLSISQSRLAWESVLDLLEEPLIYRHFDLQESDLPLIRHWVTSTHIRWGHSAEHRKQLGVIDFKENTWEAGLERLLMGVATANDDFSDQILPYTDIEGSQAQALGGFYDFYQLLTQDMAQLNTSCDLQTWGQRLRHIADQLLFIDNDFAAQREGLNDLFAKLESFNDFHQDKLSLGVIVSYLDSLANEQRHSTGFLRGQMTFCSMLPMRAIPFKIIVLLGMNEGTFPKLDKKSAFDLLDNDFRKGDRSRRGDERYQFLEILISAQQQLIITYLGQSLKDNTTIPPSIVLAELQEVVQTHYGIDAKKLVTHHPLQAFNPRYFTEENNDKNIQHNTDTQPLFSYASNACDIAKHIQQTAQEKNTTHDHHKDAPLLWWQETLAVPQPETIDIHDLFDFYHDPQRYFLNKQLQLHPQSIEPQAEEHEPFAIEGLNQYAIHQEWITRRLNGDTDDEAFFQRLQSQGRWLSCQPGMLEFSRHRIEIDAFVEKITAKEVGKRLPAQAVDMQVGDYRVVGKLNDCYEHASLFYRYATTKSSDVMQAWLHHLLQQQLQDSHPTPSNKADNKTCLVTKETDWVFMSESNNEQAQSSSPQHHLTTLIHYYLQGQSQPNSLLLPASYAWYKQKIALEQNPKARTSPMAQAKKAFAQKIEHDKHWQLLYSNETSELLLNEQFEALSEVLMRPIWQTKKEE